MLNGGLTNYARHLMLGPITGAGAFNALTNGLHLGLLTGLPTSAGTSGGGLNGCTEWTLARKAINDEGTTNPQMIRQAGDNGGWEMALQGEIEWSASDTNALAAAAAIVGVGLFDDSSGGNLIGWVELASTLTVPVGGV